jgi:hypothetical protein
LTKKADSPKPLTENQDEAALILLGKLHVDKVKKLSKVKSLEEVEFKVFSQFGEDGIIQYLINKLKIDNKIFVEFGASNYLESNTRFLLMNDNWQGLIIDGSKENIEFIKNDRIYYRHQLTALNQFITKENIDALIKKNISQEDIGLLSIDVDGNDYWIWDQIKSIKPIIVVCEYNSLFGAKNALTVPYQKDFQVSKAHYSCLYYGASLGALVDLGKQKGYDFVGCDSEGVDAFFVRNGFSSKFKKLTAEKGFVRGKFRISRSREGDFSYLSRAEAIKLIGPLKVYNLRTKKINNLTKYALS